MTFGYIRLVHLDNELASRMYVPLVVKRLTLLTYWKGPVDIYAWVEVPVSQLYKLFHYSRLFILVPMNSSANEYTTIKVWEAIWISFDSGYLYLFYYA